MTNAKEISIADYSYALPNEKIALHPLGERDAAKLLIYKNGVIKEDVFKNIAGYLPQNSLLIFNNTKVIRARILFQKQTGGTIEIFCLEPYEDIHEYSTVMNKKERVRWKCMIGGASKWKEGELEKQLAIGGSQLAVRAKLVKKLLDAYVVEFSWLPKDLTFSEVLEKVGDIPLPPYIKRNTVADDTERYQTIYAKDEGSVAAPTAGLHFTGDVFERLNENKFQSGFVTLHVGAGTFKPVKASIMQEHEMHAEWIDVGIETVEQLITSMDDPIAAVGTTSLRTLESLYWMGVKLMLAPAMKDVQLSQWEVYETPLADADISAKEALTSLLTWMKRNDLSRLFTETQILIAPGYRFKIVNALVTNFHQPRSTLLLLVAAAVGNDWKKIYDHALQHDYRFLSYGDVSLLFINTKEI